jgi:putative transposase
VTSFIKDQIVFRGEARFRLVRVQGYIAQLENIVTSELSSHNEADLLEEYMHGCLRTVDSTQHRCPPEPNVVQDALPAATSPPGQGDFEARRRVNYLVALDRTGAFERPRSALRQAIQKIAVDLNDARPPHETTVYRWRRRYLVAQCDVRALLDQIDLRGGKGQSRLDSTVDLPILTR